MKMQEVRVKAKELAIQTEEGNVPCFKTEVNDCDQMDCCWRGDCKGWVG
jgi:hypothetical protein